MRVMKVRKRPVEVHAVRVGMPWKYVAEWCGGQVITDGLKGNRIVAINVPTLEGKQLLAREGDWIIRGVKGEFYPCAPDVFEQTYDVLAEVSPDSISSEGEGDG